MSIDTDVPQIATPVAEPPVLVNFTFLGKTFRAKPITDGQLAAIAMAKGDGSAVLDITTRVIKSRVGEANWQWMHEQLVDGTCEFADIAGVLNQLAEARRTVADIANEA